MGDSWEDDWEAEADRLIAGVDLNHVDESKFEGEDAGAPDSWETSVPAPQPKKVVLSRYAAKDALYDARAAASTVDHNDPAAVARAQEEAEIRMMAEMVGSGPSKLDTMAPKSNADFDEYAKELLTCYGTVHSKSKQYKYFVKQVVKGLCDVLDKEGVKDIETTVAGVRSAKVKEERDAAAALKKGPKKSIRIENDDIAAGLDDMRYTGGYGNADDDGDFM